MLFVYIFVQDIDPSKVINKCRTLGVGRAAALDEVRLDEVRIGVLADPAHRGRLFFKSLVERAEADALGARIAEVVHVVLDHLLVKALDLVADGVLAPGDFLAHALADHPAHHLLALRREEVGLLRAQVAQDVAEQPEVRVLIAVDVVDLLHRARHAAEVVEEHESRVEVDALEDVVGDEHAQEVLARLLLLELIVEVADEGVAREQVLVIRPGTGQACSKCCRTGDLTVRSIFLLLDTCGIIRRTTLL